MNPYESEKTLSQYLLFHYGLPEEIAAPAGTAAALNYPARCVHDFMDFMPGRRALDLGCAVGRAAFELARHYPEVVALDLSAKFIGAAQHLRERGELAYERSEEGELCTTLVARVPADIDRTRVKFAVGDATALPANWGHFDFVLLANLIDRLQDPRRCLSQLPQLLNPGGTLIITSPYTWLEDFTPRANWLAATPPKVTPHPTLDGLREVLNPHFELRGLKELPFVIREHRRKFQLSVAQASVWQLKKELVL